jgi:hypothetical protein
MGKEKVVGHITSAGIFCIKCVSDLKGMVNFPIVKGSSQVTCDQCGKSF